MTYLQAKAKLANIAGIKKFSISYQETENWSPDYLETLVGITLHCGNDCVCSGTSYEHAFALLASKIDTRDAAEMGPTSAQHPDMDDMPQGFEPCPDCGASESEWYNRSAGVAVCDDCGQFLVHSKEAA